MNDIISALHESVCRLVQNTRALRVAPELVTDPAIADSVRELEEVLTDFKIEAGLK